MSPLAVSVEAGGLSVWYEIVHQHSYAPTEEFLPRRGWVVVDVGANIGVYSAWAGSLMDGVGRIIAIEPNPVSYERLLRSISHQTVPVEALEVACGDRDATVSLSYQDGYTVSGTVVSELPGSRRATVRMRRLDDVIAELGVSRVDILKIDVEGAESHVLRGAPVTLRSAERVILEADKASVSALQATLESSGLRHVHTEDSHWGVPGIQLLAFSRMRSVSLDER